MAHSMQMVLLCSFLGAGCFLDATGVTGGNVTGAGGEGGSDVTSTGGTTSITGGMGGGGSVSDGGGGSNPDGGGGSTVSIGGEGGEGGAPNPPECIVTWTVVDHAAATYLGIGGIVGANPYTKPFPGDGCMAPSIADNTVSCTIPRPPSGTIFQLNLYTYLDAGGTMAFGSRCDQPNFPTSDCPGTITLTCDDELILTFMDDNDSQTPPPAPWEYVSVDGFYELRATMP